MTTTQQIVNYSTDGVNSSKYQDALLQKINVVLGPSGLPARLLRSNASTLATDRVHEEKWSSLPLPAAQILIAVIGLLTLWTLMGVGSSGLPTSFAQPANIFIWLGLALEHGFFAGLEQLFENPAKYARYSLIIMVWGGGLSFLWLNWTSIVFRFVKPSRLQVRIFLIALPIALEFLLPPLFLSSHSSNFSRSRAKFDGFILAIALQLVISVAFLFSKGVQSMLRGRHRRRRPVEYLLNSLLETLYELREIPTGGILDNDTYDKRAAILANLEEAARCLQAVSRLTPTNDGLIASLKQEAFDRRVQRLRELKMLIVLPKADSRNWLDQELRRILDLLAAGDWEGLPLNNHDFKKLESLLRQLLTLARSLLIPIIILAIVYLAHDKIQLELRSNLIVVACGYALITLLPLIDPRFKETLLSLKDAPSFLLRSKD